MSDVLFLLCKRCEIVSDILSVQVCDMKGESVRYFKLLVSYKNEQRRC